MDGSADRQGQMNAAMLTGFRDELVREAGVVTPGVDETPYIQFAIEALTRDRDTGYSANDSLSSDETISAAREIPDQDLGYYQPMPTSPFNTRQPLDSPLPVHFQHDRLQEESTKSKPLALAAYNTTRPLDDIPLTSDYAWHPDDMDDSIGRSNHAGKGNSRPVHRSEAVPMDRDYMTDPAGIKKANGFPPIHYRPWILRPASFILLMVLCVLMLAALVFCGVYSELNSGFVAYHGSIYGGQYFLFRILPQLLAACVLIYAQCIITTVFRILPFVRLASRNEDDRYRAIYMDLYPRSFLWPQLIDRWQIWMPIFVTWLANLTLPLQSSLFTVILVNGTWTWATVQGVVWTLVGLYVALIGSTGVLLLAWARIETTGLLWDPRSIADSIVMLSDSNIAPHYKGTELAGHRSTIGFALRHRPVERLGYWAWRDGRPGFWYGIHTAEQHQSKPSRGVGLSENIHEKIVNDKSAASGYDTHRDLEASAHNASVRYRYLPWCLRTNQLILFCTAAFILLLALFIVSFLPATHISSGFHPWLSAHPGPGAFSAADFLYSFLPSLVGLVLYLLFQSLDQSVRILQPWAAMADPRGAPAGESILADYAACLPGQSTIHAIRNGHYRVAAISALSTLFVLLPVLGGGLFMALTDPKTGDVRMFPNVPAYAVLLALLVLYLAGLVGLLPYRHEFGMPHGVGCLAETIGFLMSGELRAEGAFKGVRTRAEMVRRLVGRGEDRWVFGIGSGGGEAEGELLGVRRVARYTEKRRVRKSQIRRGGRYGHS